MPVFSAAGKGGDQMPHVVSLVLLALAVSLDGLGAGVMYGLRRIKIPFHSLFIICCCSGIVIFGSMQLGSVVLQWISPRYAAWIGAVILIGIGCWAIVQMLMQQDQQEQSAGPAPETGLNASSNDLHAGNAIHPMQSSVVPLYQIELKRLGLVIRILRTPAAADVDRSGTISASEAALLGAALSLDAFGAGLGAALIGFSPLYTSLTIAISSGALIWFGLRVGLLFSGARWVRRLSIVPGCILIAMGIFRLF